uniref:NR LBD domain-containing protein n=1 Tax=Steinernema glaseri TaxID=37863 RepID=A0A1I8A0W4_9BILA
MDGIFSSICVPTRVVHCRNASGKCLEFIEKQIALGRLRELNINGQNWPDSMKASLKSFLKSPNFVKLDLERTNLTVDLDMLTCVVQRFLEGDLRKGTRLEGKPSEEMENLHRQSRLCNSFPLLNGLSKQLQTFRSEYDKIFWCGPGPERLSIFFSYNYSVLIFQD